MLIITVETQSAHVNFLPGHPLAAAATGELARNWCTGRSEIFHQRVSLELQGSLRAPIDGVLRSRVESLIDGGVRRVSLDLSGVSDIDAAGVGELMQIFTTVTTAGGALEIERMNPHVRRVLEVSGVLGLLDVEYPGARSTCR